MYERFTDRARKVMQLANQEAQRFNHEYIGTEHVLLGLIKEGSGVAANVLKNLDIDLRKIRMEVEKLVQSGPDMVTMGKLPQTPRAKKVSARRMSLAWRPVSCSPAWSWSWQRSGEREPRFASRLSKSLTLPPAAGTFSCPAAAPCPPAPGAR